MDCICFKGKPRKRKESNHFHPLSQGVSPTHSQPSTLGQDGRLPKVNSTGLWLGAPGMYTAAPSEAYYYGHPASPRNHLEPIHLQRATSEMRIPASMPHPPPQRIYHSQQLAPVYEGQLSRGLAIYDPYPFLGHANGGPPRHSPYLYANENFRLGPKLERSSSDAHHSQRSDQRLLHSTNTSSSSRDRRSQHSFHDSSVYLKSQPNSEKRISAGSEFARDTGRGQRSGSDVNGSYDNRGFSPESGHSHKTHSHTSSTVSSNTHLPNGTLGMVSAYVSKPGLSDVTASATDSMKILAKNKTDDQKTHPPFSEADEDLGLAVAGSDVRHHQYNYSGGLHSKPVELDPNPHLSLMKAMVDEKTRYHNPIKDDGAQQSDKHDLYTKFTRVTRSEVTENGPAGTDINRILNGLVLPENSDDKPAVHSPLGVTLNHGDSLYSERNLEQSNVSQTFIEKKEKVEIISSKKVDEHDDVANAGKITDSAFQFLDNYLSEDEGTDAPSLSSGVHRVEGLVN